MRWIAHRGAPNGDLGENSISTFRRALEHFDWIELDVRLLCDSSLVVLHDQTLKRTTTAPSSLHSIPVQWLRADEVTKHSLRRPRGTTECIPHYSQVLDLVKTKPEALLFTELKDHHPHAAQVLAGVLADHPARQQVVVLSFCHEQLRYIRQISELQICPLYQFRSAEVDNLECEWEAPMAEPLFFTPGLVRRIQAKHQRRVIPWFLFAQSSSLARERLAGMGVDGLMIDTLP